MNQPITKSQWASLVSTHNGGIVVGLATRHLYFSSTDQFHQAIHSGHLKVKKWIVAIPRNLCILKPLTLPARSLSEAIQMADFELSTLSPIPPQEAIYSCWPISKKDSQLEVMVCLLRSSQIEKLFTPLRQLGIEPKRLVVSSLAFSPQFHAPAFPKDCPVIVAVTDHSQCEVISFQNESLLVATPLINQAKHIAQEIDSQLESSLFTNPKDIHLFLAGPPEQLDAIKTALNKNVKKDQIQQIKTITNTKASTTQQPSDYDILQAHGLAVLAEKNYCPQFNLLSREVLTKRRSHQRRRFLTLLSTQASLIIFLLWLGTWALSWREKQRCNQIETQIAPLKQTAGQVEGKQQQIKSVAAQFNQRQSINDLFIDLFRHTPSHITFSSLSYQNKSGQATIRFKGQADHLANAFGYTEAMRQAKSLNAIQIENIQQVARTGGSVVEFSGMAQIGKQ